MPAWTMPAPHTPGHDAQTATTDALAAERDQDLIFAQRTELHLDLTDDVICDLAVHAVQQETGADR